MDHNQRFKPLPPAQQQVEENFEFKPLDLEKLGQQKAVATKEKKRVAQKVPCLNCGNPRCPGSRIVWVME